MNIFNKYWQKLLVLAFGHGLNDFTAGYMLGYMVYSGTGITSIAAGFLIYNLLAFGGQYFAAIILEKFSNKKIPLTIAASFNIIAVTLFYFSPYVSLIIAGCASAIYHVAGGTACVKENRAIGIGIFAAPGIAGLVLAGYFAFLKLDIWLQLHLVSTGFVLLLQLVSIPSVKNVQEVKPKQRHIGIEQHDVLMILLLALISLRSAVWNIFQIIHDQNYTWLLAIAASAFAGKIFGGWLSDRIGWKLYSIISLTTAMPLVSFFKDELLLFCLGVGLLQSAIPANTMMMINYCKGQKERAFAFSFGTAIIIGVLITSFIKVFSVNDMIFSLMIFLLILSWMIVQRKSGFFQKKGVAVIDLHE